jgi:hypothetical protein
VHLVPGALIILDGDDEGLFRRLVTVNERREVLRPAPLVLRRDSWNPGLQSASRVQPALACGVPVIISGGSPSAVVAVDEPLPDLFATVRTTDVASEPTVTGTIRNGFRVDVDGRHSAEQFMHLIQAFVQASLAGLPVRT